MDCHHRAILIITRQFPDTASNIAKERFALQCTLPAGHDGPHRDTNHDESWEDQGSRVTHILRDENEA